MLRDNDNIFSNKMVSKCIYSMSNYIFVLLIFGMTTTTALASIPSALHVYPTEYHVRIEKSDLEKNVSAVFHTHLSPRMEWIHDINEKFIFKPFKAFLHCKSYFYQPYPGENKNVATQYKLGVKLAAFVGCIIMALPAFPSLVLGLAIRAAEHKYRPFLSYYKSLPQNAPPVLELSQGNPLHIGSLNVSLTPASVNIEMDMRCPMQRAEEIACSLLEDPHRPQVLFIEEGWHEDALRHLCIRLKTVYPHIIHSVAPHVLGMSSGIAVFSIYPFEQLEYVRFGEMVFTHRLPARGFLKVCLLDAKGEKIYLYGGIHTQSMEGYAYAQARLHQVKQLVRRVALDGSQEKCMQAIIGDFNMTLMDLHGYDNRGQAEQPVLEAMETCFTDPFLQDHDVFGNRKQGTPFFLEHDNKRMGLQLPEPQGSWYDGPFTEPHEIQAIQKPLNQEAIRYGFPTRKCLPERAITQKPVWGTPEWFTEQPAQRARYDYAFFPKYNQTLEGKVEYRRLVVPPQTQSAPTDHLLLSFLIWKKT